MLLLTTCRRALRRTALASALGAGLMAPAAISNPLFAQHPTAYQPRLLPTQAARPINQSSSTTLLPPAPYSGAAAGPMAPPAIESQGVIQSTAAARSANQRQNQQQMEHAQYVDPVEKPSLFSRMFRALRKDSAIPSGPPQDPGMNYPTGDVAPRTNVAGQGISAPSGGSDILIPPDWNRGVVVSPPAMLMPPPVNGAGGVSSNLTIQPPSYSGSIGTELEGQRTASADPGANFLVPPPAEGSKEKPTAPAAMPVAEKGTATGLTPPPMVPPKVEGIDLGNEPQVAKVPAATPQQSDLPVFTLDSPERGTAELADEPEEDMDLLLLPAPVGQAPTQTTPPAAVPEAPVAATEGQASAGASGSNSTETTGDSPAKTEQPYTGLTLEEDMFKAPAAKVEAETPSEETVFQAPIPAPSTPKEEPLDIAEESSPMLPPVPAAPAEATAPAVSPSETGAPAPLPGVSTTAKAPEVEAPAAPPAVTQAPDAEQAPAVSPKAEIAKPKVPTPPAVAASKKPAANDPNQSKLDAIRSRPGSGLKGYCAVALQNERELKDSREEFSALFHGRLYSFSSEQALETFLADPARYAPAARGNDVIHLALTGEEVEGSLDHAVWYQGRLYLFTSVETLETFTAAPSSHATNE